MVLFPSALHRATFEKRYKRFFADAVLDDGTRVTAHCPNTGSMATCMTPGDIIWLSYNNSPTRKLKWTWELTETMDGYIGINTALPNKIVEDGIQAQLIPEVSGYSELLREVKYSINSRIDLLLKHS
ncbi:MAG: DNA/RNA nuclease SfsA, partial [Proteobacteria bacterium]|nr:DNA/RNA nuclease SfsA [Pseudomonadota bacterium]